MNTVSNAQMFKSTYLANVFDSNIG